MPRKKIHDYDPKVAHRAAAKRHAAKKKAAKAPRAEDVTRALGHSVRAAVARFVNIAGNGPKASAEERAVVQSLLVETQRELEARGFDQRAVVRAVIRSIKPVAGSMASSPVEPSSPEPAING